MTLADATAARLLIYGIGNPGRQDDGVGVLAIERLEQLGLRPGVTLDSGYQLAPEDALTVSQHDAVIFVDATVASGAPTPYEVRAIEPAATPTLTTHDVSIESILALCRELYAATPRAAVVAIPAYGFEVNAPLSPQASRHLDTVVTDLQAALAR